MCTLAPSIKPLVGQGIENLKLDVICSTSGCSVDMLMVSSATLDSGYDSDLGELDSGYDSVSDPLYLL